jgi:hypothetical protein
LRIENALGGYCISEIVMHDLAEMQGEIGDDVDGGEDFEHRQIGKRRQYMMRKLQ